HITIETSQPKKGMFTKLFSKNSTLSQTRFITEIVLRNPDGSELIESIF
ncbi:MAG: hypothetical protein RIT37_1118, partial [Bacteroidota bacterium]